MLSNWTQSSNNINQASFAIALEIAKNGKLFTDGQSVKDYFIRASDELFHDFKNKAEIMNKIKYLPPSTKIVQYKISKMFSNLTNMQVKNIQNSNSLCLITCYR